MEHFAEPTNNVAEKKTSEESIWISESKYSADEPDGPDREDIIKNSELVTKSGSIVKPQVDDAVIYKVVEELEEWKERQKKMFVHKMKRKEKKLLDALSSEWHIKRERLEVNLSKVLSESQVLMKSLKDSLADLEERQNKMEAKEKWLKYLKDDMERRYQTKLQELHDTSARVEKHCEQKIEFMETQIKEKEQKNFELQKENLVLEEKVKELNKEIENINKGSLTKDQIAHLVLEVKSLQEKLDIADQTKTFFKQQWAKALREFHTMKLEHQESLQTQIKLNKDELKKLCTSPRSDVKIEDEQPRSPDYVKKMFGRSPKINASGDAINNIRYGLPPRPTPKTARSEISLDDRLQILIEERNSLLQTGIYTPHDDVMKGVDQEIKSISEFLKLRFSKCAISR